MEHSILKKPLEAVFAGEQLLAGSPPGGPAGLYYWHRESSASNAEVDYVIASGEVIYGVEVKAATTGRMQSLRLFLAEDPRRRGVRLSHENSGRVNGMRIVPLYAAELLTRGLQETA